MYFVKFHVTGTDVSGKRFKRMSFSSFHAANMINLWEGSVWGVLENGRRKLLKRVYN
tara:strand:+ start:78 stop:248 length:171 start_codon:yes stop_codon:yes gene_type:complete